MADDPSFVVRSEYSSKHRRTLNDVEEHWEFPVSRLAWWVRRRYEDVVKMCSVGLSILIVPDLFALQTLRNNWRRSIDAVIEMLTVYGAPPLALALASVLCHWRALVAEQHTIPKQKSLDFDIT